LVRKSNSALVQEELYPPAAELPERERLDDSRLLDLEAEQESPFLRAQKRVSVRKNALPRKTAKRLLWVVLAIIVLVVLGTAAGELYSYGKHSWRFRIDSSDQIEITGAQHVTHAQIMEVMGGDIGRDIFFIPLDQRKLQLEQIPWVESASVMRFVPNRLRVEIHERTPVAFAHIGSHISLIDAGGTLMEFTPGGKRKYSFPVIAGMNSGEPLSVRAARMKNYNALVRDLDSSGAHYSQELSEVDLSDPEDVKVVVADPNGDVLIHLGTGNYLQRYKIYVSHVQQWRQQFDKVESVNLRYDGQIIVNPDLQGIAHQPALTPAVAKAAMAAGVKPAAIVAKYVEPPARVDVKKPAMAKKKAFSKGTHKPAPPAVAKAKTPAGKAKAKPLLHVVAKTTPAPAAATSTSAKLPNDANKTANKTAVGAAQSSSASSQLPGPAAPASKVSASPVFPTATAVNPNQKKPSAGIPKETSQQP
jgi:cell division protein FtsQ